jgi:hypothetical protein
VPHAGQPQDRDVLLSYAETDGHPIDDQLDRGTVEIVERLTGYDDVWSAQRSARALLAQHLAERDP